MRSEKNYTKKDRLSNKKGMITAVIFFVCFLALLATFIGGKFGSSKVNYASIPTVSAQELHVDVTQKKAFSKSYLQQTYAEKIREAQLEKARQEREKKDKQDKAIYLTFDDGPSPESGKLLDTLDKFNAKATFFMLGPHVKEHPDIVKRMVAEGHAVGSHGITHQADLFYGSAKAPVNEMTLDKQIIADITGVQSQLIRTPYGSIPYLTEDMRGQLTQKRFKVWDWNIDSRDWEFKNSKYVAYTISQIGCMAQTDETPIVLLHDKPETITYLPRLLKYLQANGYQTKILTNEMAPYTFKCEGRCRPYNSK